MFSHCQGTSVSVVILCRTWGTLLSIQLGVPDSTPFAVHLGYPLPPPSPALVNAGAARLTS